MAKTKETAGECGTRPGRPLGADKAAGTTGRGPAKGADGGGDCGGGVCQLPRC